MNKINLCSLPLTTCKNVDNLARRPRHSWTLSLKLFSSFGSLRGFVLLDGDYEEGSRVMSLNAVFNYEKS